VILAETMQDRKARVCGTMRTNKGHSTYLEHEAKHLLTMQSAFCRNGDVTVQVGMDKRLVRLIKVIHDATVVNTGRKDRRTGPDIKKPYVVFQ
jgi:hypothetical protein